MRIRAGAGRAKVGTSAPRRSTIAPAIAPTLAPREDALEVAAVDEGPVSGIEAALVQRPDGRADVAAPSLYVKGGVCAEQDPGGGKVRETAPHGVRGSEQGSVGVEPREIPVGRVGKRDREFLGGPLV